MDISGYKFVVSSGCSYGMLPNAVFNFFGPKNIQDKLIKEFGNDCWLDIDGNRVISLNLSLGGQGSDWQSDSLIYVVDELLKLGVKSENIFCLVEWSQWNRLSVHPPHHYGLDLDKLNFGDIDSYISPGHELEYYVTGKNEIINEDESRSILNFFRNHLKIYRSNVFGFTNMGKVEDRVYISVNQMGRDFFKNIGEDYKLFHDDYNKILIGIPLENKIKIYLDNILRTQYFLEKNNLSYNFCFMQSTLSDWGFTNNKVMSHPLFNLGIRRCEIIGDRIIFNSKFNPVNNPNSDIEIIMPEIKTKMNQLNFDNIWFHENERFRRGGIDEWVIDNLKETGYVDLSNLNHLDHNFFLYEIAPDYGFHPNLVAYILLWNKITFNCGFVKVKPEFEQFILEKYWEDYNYDGISKNHITISKKEWDRISKNNIPKNLF
jgi:hypothetical protein